MTDPKPLSLDQYRTALGIDRQQAVDLLRHRAETRRIEAEVLTEHRRMLLVELAELRKPRSLVRRNALRAAAERAKTLIPLLDEARKVEQQWRLEREHPHVWNAA